MKAQSAFDPHRRRPEIITRGVGSFLRQQPERDEWKEACLLQFPKVKDVRGNLTFIEGFRHIPFPIRRVYYLYDVPSGESRGGHAHRLHRECLIAASGSFTVTLDDGIIRQDVTLNRPDVGLYSPSMIWRELTNFSSGSICLVLASEEYDESDYYRNYDDFLRAASCPSADSVS